MATRVLCDVDNESVIISDKYNRGKIAVYDCMDQHLVCTDEVSIRTCKEFNEKSRPCVVIKEYESKDLCESFVSDLVSSYYRGDFCKSFIPSF